MSGAPGSQTAARLSAMSSAQLLGLADYLRVELRKRLPAFDQLYATLERTAIAEPTSNVGIAIAHADAQRRAVIALAIAKGEQPISIQDAERAIIGAHGGKL